MNELMIVSDLLTWYKKDECVNTVSEVRKVSSNKQTFSCVLSAIIAAGWLTVVPGDCDSACAKDRSRYDLIADKSLERTGTEDNQNATPELKQVEVFMQQGDSVVMHTGNEEVTIRESTPVGLKGDTYFVVTGDVSFGYHHKKSPSVVVSSSVRVGGMPVVTAARQGSIQVQGSAVRVDFDSGPDVRLSGARDVHVSEGSSLIATKCRYVTSHEGAVLVATDCENVDVRTGSKATVTNCRDVRFMTNGTGTASGCHYVTVRDASAECNDCDEVKVWGEAKVTTQNCATVETRGNCEVTAKGAKVIEAWGESKIFYTGSPQIKVLGSAVVRKI